MDEDQLRMIVPITIAIIFFITFLGLLLLTAKQQGVHDGTMAGCTARDIEPGYEKCCYKTYNQDHTLNITCNIIKKEVKQ